MHDVARVHLKFLQRAPSAQQKCGRLTVSISWAIMLRRYSAVRKSSIRPEGKAVEFDGVDDALFVNVHPLAGAETFTWEVIFRPYKGGKAEQRFFHLQSIDPVTKGRYSLRACFSKRA